MSNEKITKAEVAIERRDVGEILGALDSITKALKGHGSFHLMRALKLNQVALRTEQDAIEDAALISPEMEAYERARLELCRECAVQENGEPVLNADGTFAIDPARVAEFRSRLQELRTEHAPAIRAHEERQKTWPKFLRESVTVTVYQFPVALLPAKDLTAWQRMTIMPLYVDAVEVAGLEGDPQCEAV